MGNQQLNIFCNFWLLGHCWCCSIFLYCCYCSDISSLSASSEYWCSVLHIHKGSTQKWVCFAIMDNCQLLIKQSASSGWSGQEIGSSFFCHHVNMRAGEWLADGSPPLFECSALIPSHAFAYWGHTLNVWLTLLVINISLALWQFLAKIYVTFIYVSSWRPLLFLRFEGNGAPLLTPV